MSGAPARVTSITGSFGADRTLASATLNTASRSSGWAVRTTTAPASTTCPGSGPTAVTTPFRSSRNSV